MYGDISLTGGLFDPSSQDYVTAGRFCKEPVLGGNCDQLVLSINTDRKGEKIDENLLRHRLRHDVGRPFAQRTQTRENKTK